MICAPAASALSSPCCASGKATATSPTYISIHTSMHEWLMIYIYIYIYIYINKYTDIDIYIYLYIYMIAPAASALSIPYSASGRATSSSSPRCRRSAGRARACAWTGGPKSKYQQANVLNTQSRERNTVFYSDWACFANTLTLNMYVSMSFHRVQQAECSVFLWLRHRNTWIRIQHVG